MRLEHVNTEVRDLDIKPDHPNIEVRDLDIEVGPFRH